MREITRRYRDPLDEIWLATAAKLGYRVRRSDDAFAHYDGAGTLYICTPTHFDADDSLAQLIFHELCHAIIAGPGAHRMPDWGLRNEDARDLDKEHACHRLQAGLAAHFGLGELLSVTTDHRNYWDTLPEDPLALPPEGVQAFDPAIELARAAWEAVRNTLVHTTLFEALAATAAVARAGQAFVVPESLLHAVRPLHAVGYAAHPDAERRCGACAWYRTRGSRSGQCRVAAADARADSNAVAPEMGACRYFEGRLREEDCGSCGACCHRGFDVVQLRPRDAIRRLRPEWVVGTGQQAHLPRPDGRCVALAGDGSAGAPYRCQEYEDRPRSCRDFAVGGDACREGRKRAGLGPWTP
ncbi:MAG: YkgJ family cysteine cluster protein [Myxococcales bacterium]|nr:YkgJ family cysteine cluster protein [Myxococcales bacterium]